MSNNISDLKLGPNVDAKCKIYDLAAVPLPIALLEIAALEFRDFMIQAQFDREVQELQSHIDKSITNPKVGFLIEVIIFIDCEGFVTLPRGRMLSPIGLGKEPLDAYAEFLGRDNLLPASLPSNDLINNSSFVWITKDKDKFEGKTIDKTIYSEFRQKAEREVNRRKLLSNWHRALPSSNLKTIEIAGYWNDVNNQRLEMIADAARQNEVKQLTEEMNSLQNQANELYIRYQKVAEGLAQQQKYYDTLNTISTVANIIGSAVELNEIMSRDNHQDIKNTDDSFLPKMSTSIEYTREVISSQGNEKTQLRETVDIYFNDIKGLSNQIRDIYRNGNVPLPVEPDVNGIPLILP